MIEIVRADRSMIAAVLADLRTADAREIAAAGTDTSLLPDLIMMNGVFCFCAHESSHGAIAVWGMIKRREGVGGGFAFGTERWPRAVIPMLRQIRGFVLPYLRIAGYHRVEAAALAGRDDIEGFMTLIDAEPEGRLRGYGIHGEDFISYRWLAHERHEHHHRTAHLHAAH